MNIRLVLKIFLISLVSCQSNILDDFHLSIIQILCKKYNIQRLHIFFDESYKSDLIKIINKDFSMSIFFLKGVSKPYQIFESDLVIFITNFENETIAKKEQVFFISVRTVIITEIKISDIPFFLLVKNYIILQNNTIITESICESESSVNVTVENVHNIDLYLMGLCRYVVASKGFFSEIAFPLVVKLNSTHSTGRFYYFNKEFLKYLNMKLMNFSKKSSKLEIQPSISFPRRGVFNIEFLKNCIMVPKIRLLSQEKYISNIYCKFTWSVIIVSLFYIAFINKYVFEISYFEGLQQAITLTTWTSCFPIFKNLSKLNFVVFILLIFYGFFLNNTYLSKLSTYLTSYVYGKQIENVDDFIQSELKILTYFNSFNTFPGKLQKSFIIEENRSKVNDFIFNLNSSFAYPVLKNVWKYLERSQSLLSKKKFKYTNICEKSEIETILVPMVPKLYMEAHYFRFTLLVHEAGLMDVWDTFSYIDLERRKLFKYLKDNEEVRKPLSLLFFKKIWYLLFTGHTLGFVSFVLEILLKSGQNPLFQRFQR